MGECTHYMFGDPNPTQPTNGRKVKEKTVTNSGTQKNIYAAHKARQSAPSNTRSSRQFHRKTERGTKVLQYIIVLLRGGSNECQ